MDLRKEIHDIIEESGHFILLQRKSKKIRCDCWNEKYQSADPKCSKCLGLGKVSRIERHKIRRQSAYNLTTAPNVIKQSPVGRIETDIQTFFMKHDVQPQNGDIIMEVGWHRTQPTHLIRSFEIIYPEELRGDNGRVEFYQVGAKEQSIDTSIRGFVVRRLGPTRNYEAIHRGLVR